MTSAIKHKSQWCTNCNAYAIFVFSGTSYTSADFEDLRRWGIRSHGIYDNESTKLFDGVYKFPCHMRITRMLRIRIPRPRTSSGRLLAIPEPLGCLGLVDSTSGLQLSDGLIWMRPVTSRRRLPTLRLSELPRCDRRTGCRRRGIVFYRCPTTYSCDDRIRIRRRNTKRSPSFVFV